MNRKLGVWFAAIVFAGLSAAACKVPPDPQNMDNRDRPARRMVPGSGRGMEKRGGDAQAGRMERRGPPPEASRACEGKALGEACRFETRRGRPIEGRCENPRGEEMVCVPEGGPRGGRDDGRGGPSPEGGQDQAGPQNRRRVSPPPEEAVSACVAIAEGHNCEFVAPNGDRVSGVCRSIRGQTACQPEGGGLGGPQGGGR